jgi:formylmethanofuran dehydrogenase subunit B
MSAERRVEHVTCLGCGCGCDDVTVTVLEDRIVQASPVCPLGQAWFGDGRVPVQVQRDGRPVSLTEALTAAAAELADARGRCLVFLGPDISSQAQRTAMDIADLLRATVDGETSATAAAGLLTAQRRGRATATLGEIRNRGDVFLFWGVDPNDRYPRFAARYGPGPVGTHVPEGRAGRYVIAVSVGVDKAFEDADLALELEPDQELLALSFMRSSVLGREIPGSFPGAALVRDVTKRLTQARYAVLVHDAEPTAEPRDPLRIEALIALAQTLNGPTRAVLCSLRSGGNRVGAEAVMTAHTGYPFAVDYSRGFPRYEPAARGLERLGDGVYQTALLVGSPPSTESVHAALSRVSTIAIGPRASQGGFPNRIAIDTGIAGIHEAGTAYRMDEVPLALRPPLSGPPLAVDVLAALREAVRSRLGEVSR